MSSSSSGARSTAGPPASPQPARARRGRPRVQDTGDDIVASVLATAGARVGGSEYTTREIALLTGLSQTVVSRAVRRIRHPGRDETPQRLESAPGAALRIEAFAVEFPQITIRFATTRDQAGQRQPRAVDRRMAALMAGLHVSGAAEWSAGGAAALRPPRGTARTETMHAETTRAETTHAQTTHAGTTHGETARTETAVEDPLTARWRPGDGSWEDFLHTVAGLLDRCAADPEAVPGTLLREIARRAGRGLHGLRWSRRTEDSTPSSRRIFDSVSDPDGGASTSRAAVQRWLPRSGLSVTEQIAIALRQEITDSGFRPGDRLSPRALAGALGLGQSTVRTAMRRLSDDGLLIHSEGAFSIPALSGVDVIDLYAARLHTGIVLLRGCATVPRHRFLAARLALSAVEATARRGTRSDLGHADLLFQHELAEASGLVQSARSFHGLTLRLRMFISILQLDYGPAVERIVSDDRLILAAVLDGRTEDAVRVFRGKLDHAVRHMCALAPDTFDARLWERLVR